MTERITREPRKGPLLWTLARVVENAPEAENARTLTLQVEDWAGHRPGQHVDVRLTAEDGYQALRSYSLAAPAEGSRVRLTVQHLSDGEVSPYLTDVLVPGDQVELRGPIGGYFTWEAEDGGPLLLIAGGSGVVPLMCMIRHWHLSGRHASVRLLYSARTIAEVFYREELSRLAADPPGLDLRLTITRGAPPRWTGLTRRVDGPMLEQVAFSPAERPRIFVCGPTPFVEVVGSLLLRMGHPRESIKTERFGPTGGTR